MLFGHLIVELTKANSHNVCDKTINFNYLTAKKPLLFTIVKLNN